MNINSERRTTCALCWSTSTSSSRRHNRHHRRCPLSQSSSTLTSDRNRLLQQQHTLDPTRTLAASATPLERPRAPRCLLQLEAELMSPYKPVAHSFLSVHFSHLPTSPLLASCFIFTCPIIITLFLKFQVNKHKNSKKMKSKSKCMYRFKSGNGSASSLGLCGQVGVRPDAGGHSRSRLRGDRGVQRHVRRPSSGSEAHPLAGSCCSFTTHS